MTIDHIVESLATSGKHDRSTGRIRLPLLRRLANWWRMNQALAHAHCKAVCRQRDADYQEFLVWKGIVK